ncbi:MAG: type II toxin-antitoxin system RelE/ParE family toxin, partial [Acidobacteria bacterium]|nr:type II toxin-antitoxin system RelE/ParE family toxin [Acidobacteriota bacterium]
MGLRVVPNGRDRVEAIALIGLLGQQGNQLRRPQSGMLGDGLFELRGKQIRIFYMFLPGWVIVLLDGEIMKQNKVPSKTIERKRRHMKETLSRHKGGDGSRGEEDGDEDGIHD